MDLRLYIVSLISDVPRLRGRVDGKLSRTAPARASHSATKRRRSWPRGEGKMIVSSCSTRYNTIFATSRYSSRASSCLEAGAVACIPAAERSPSVNPSRVSATGAYSTSCSSPPPSLPLRSDPSLTMTTVRHTEPYDGYYWVVLGGANKAQTGIWINSR